MLGDVHEQVVEQFQQHRIGAFGASGNAGVALGGAAQQHVIQPADLGGPAGLHHGGGVGFADQRRSGDAVAGGQCGSFIDRGVVGGAAAPDADRINRAEGGGAARGEVGLHHRLPRCDCLDRHRFDDQAAIGRGEAEAGAMGGGEGGGDRSAVGEIDDQRRLGAEIAHMQLAADMQRAIGGTLAAQLGFRLSRQAVGEGVQAGQSGVGQRSFNRLFAHDRLICQAHAEGGEHAGEGVDEHGFHAQFVRHQAGVLAAGAAEALQGEAADIMAFLHADLLDRVGHVGDRDAQKPLRQGARVLRLAGGLRHLGGQSGEFRLHHLGVQRFVAFGAENGREVRGHDFADADVGVRHRQRAAAPVAGRAGIGAGAVRADAQAGAVEMQDGTAAGGDGVDRHHRRAHPHPGDGGFKRTLKRAIVQRDVGGGAAHVEADDARQAGGFRRARGADDAAGGAGEDGVLALEVPGFGQPAIGLHEIEPHALQLAGDLIDIAAQNGGEIGIHHRGIAARHDAQQRRDGVAGGDLAEAGIARQFGQTLFMRRIFPGMHQHDGDSPDALGAGSGEGGAGGGFVQRFDLCAVYADPTGDFHHIFIEQAGQGNFQVEQTRPCLVADAQHVRKALVDHQQRAFPLAFQQRVGGDRGAHFHAIDQAGRDRGRERDAEHAFNAGDGGVAVAFRVFAEQLVGAELARRVSRHDVGEGAAAIDPELPRCHDEPCCHIIGRRAC